MLNAENKERLENAREILKFTIVLGQMVNTILLVLTYKDTSSLLLEIINITGISVIIPEVLFGLFVLLLFIKDALEDIRKVIHLKREKAGGLSK